LTNLRQPSWDGGSSSLVTKYSLYFLTYLHLLNVQQASELQQKIENAGGQVLKDQKAKVANIQSVSTSLLVCFLFLVCVCLSLADAYEFVL
jgi:hypothetical protein